LLERDTSLLEAVGSIFSIKMSFRLFCFGFLTEGRFQTSLGPYGNNVFADKVDEGSNGTHK
jgi:hypothetical protein